MEDKSSEAGWERQSSATGGTMWEENLGETGSKIGSRDVNGGHCRGPDSEE